MDLRVDFVEFAAERLAQRRIAGIGVVANVLFISIDDLNDYISPLDNHPGVRTPKLDQKHRLPPFDQHLLLVLHRH